MALPRSSLETYDYGGDSSEKNKPSAANYPGGSSDSFLLRAVNGYHRRREAEMHHSLINFRSGYQNFGPTTDGSLLSFGQNDCSVWNQINGGKYGSHHAPPPRTVEDSFETAAASPFVAQTRNCSPKEIVNYHGEWFYSEENVAVEAFPEARMAPDQTNSLKRPNMGDGSNQITKKQCSSGSSKKAKPKSSGISKDPQSIAAKNRRERISERLKILQDLVPNGSKVDLVTMLEKAISYVKFLQLQVKVLATDEFWPAQGGKAPDICEVKEAIEAILSSQRDRNSCSSTSK